jgi:hypothetical protein
MNSDRPAFDHSLAEVAEMSARQVSMIAGQCLAILEL